MPVIIRRRGSVFASNPFENWGDADVTRQENEILIRLELIREHLKCQKFFFCPLCGIHSVSLETDYILQFSSIYTQANTE